MKTLIVSFILFAIACNSPSHSQESINPNISYNLEKGIYLEGPQSYLSNISNLLEKKFKSAGILIEKSKRGKHNYIFNFRYTRGGYGRGFSEFKGVLKTINGTPVANFEFSGSELVGTSIDAVLSEIVNKISSKNTNRKDAKRDVKKDQMDGFDYDELKQRYTRKKLDKYFIGNDTLKELEGLYKLKLSFPNNQEIIIGDVALTVSPQKGYYLGWFFASVMDTIPDTWGILEETYAEDILYGNISNRAIGEVELRVEKGIITFKYIVERTYVAGTLIKLFPKKSTKKPSSSGTGFIISSDGILVTNYHVIAGYENFDV
jgi:hypothetical protein